MSKPNGKPIRITQPTAPAGSNISVGVNQGGQVQMQIQSADSVFIVMMSPDCADRVSGFLRDMATQARTALIIPTPQIPKVT